MSAKTSPAILFVLMSLTTIIPVYAWSSEEVKAWVGTFEDYAGSHDPSHTARSEEHAMKFTRISDGESFYVTEGTDTLLKEHLESDKTLLIEVDGRITSKFLFFGGNMIIEKAKVLQQVTQVAHRAQRTRERSEKFENMGRRNR